VADLVHFDCGLCSRFAAADQITPMGHRSRIQCMRAAEKRMFNARQPLFVTGWPTDWRRRTLDSASFVNDSLSTPVSKFLQAGSVAIIPIHARAQSPSRHRRRGNRL
jgi:hypothetical protein